MTELLVNFVFCTCLRPPINVKKFRQGKLPSYVLRGDCANDVTFEAYTFAKDLRMFEAAHQVVQETCGYRFVAWGSLDKLPKFVHSGI